MKKQKLDKALFKVKNYELSGFSKKKRIIIDVVMILIGISWIFLMVNLFISKPSTYKAEFVRCVDGDTIELKIDYKIETVNLLNVISINDEDTCNLVTNAKKITVEYEKEKYDEEGNLLAWVYIDDKLLQKLLLESGNAKLDAAEYKRTSELLDI